MSIPRKRFASGVTDDQVASALDAAQDEFACWRMMPMGGAGTRFVRDPLAGRLHGQSTPEDGTTLSITYHDTPDTGQAAEAAFDNMRAHAGMRAALETIR